MKYDVVIIGAGNGGLTSAVRASLGGKKILLLEKHNLPGGFATSFKRGRFEFEASLHELNDFGTYEEPGDVRLLFRELGVEDKIQWISVPEAYRVITLEGEKVDVTMPFGVENFIEAMEKYVPGSEKSMRKFFELAEEIRLAQQYTASVNGNTDSKVMKRDYPNFVRCGSYSVNEVLEALKMPKRAMDIFNAYWCYLGAHCEDLSFVHYASMVYRYILREAYIPAARSHEISLAFIERLRELQGDVWFNSEVTKILTDKDKKICGVELKDGTKIETKHIIANCSPHVVYGRLLDKAAIPELEIRATNSRKFAGRGFSMFLGLNKSPKELKITNHNYFIYRTLDTVEQYNLMKEIKDNDVQATVCLNNAYPKCSPEGTTIMYFTTMYMSDAWAKVEVEDYFNIKEKVAERLIENFEKATGCEIKDAIEEISIATPLTYARYCGHPQGVIYGYESQYWDGLLPRLMMMNEDHRIEGLRFAGGFSMRLSGYSSAYFSGDIVAKQTLGDIRREEN